MRDFLFRGPRERGRGRERQRVVDARMQSMDPYIPYIYTYLIYALPTSKSKMSQAACYASRLSVVLDALLSFPTAQPGKKNPRLTLGEIPGLGGSC